jgi:hypothetical protein
MSSSVQTFGNVSLGLTNNLGDPPATSGFVSAAPVGPVPGPLTSGAAVAFNSAIQ